MPIGSFWRRLLYAIKYQETNFLLSEAVNKNSKLLYVRNPRDRVEKVAPFLTLDGDPYPAVVDGRIQWILDGYTTAATYPYAEQVNLQTETTDELTNTGTFQLARENVNYMRNSVKATVDAYDGTVKLYAFDDTDPVLKAWNKAFGGKLVMPQVGDPGRAGAALPLPGGPVQGAAQPADPVPRHQARATSSRGQDFWQVPNVPGRAGHAGRSSRRTTCSRSSPGRTQPRFQLTAAVTPSNRRQPGRADLRRRTWTASHSWRCSSCRTRPGSPARSRCTADDQQRRGPDRS